MTGPFHFSTATAETESWLVGELGLDPLTLDPLLADAEGTWKGSTAVICTRAYRGGAVRYARFAVLTGRGLEIGNALCLSDPVHPLPIFGADLVGLGRETGMLAVDLSPTLPEGPQRDAQLAALAARRALHPPLPPGGRLPDWCAAWFSPYAMYTRIEPPQLDQALGAFCDFARVFAGLAGASGPRPDLAAAVALAQDGYAAAHRTEDKGLKLLVTMFGRAWAERYVAEVLFPPAEAMAC